MSKKMNLQVGEYSLDLEVSREILLDAFMECPQMEKVMTKGGNPSISQLYKFTEIALFCMASFNDSTFTKEKAKEIFDYARECIVEVENEEGEIVEQQAIDVLVPKIMEFVNLGFTNQDNAKKIKITLS